MVNQKRLKEVAALPLDSGSHEYIRYGMCVMEAVSYVAGEPWSDSPECACPVIAAFLRSWNDALPDDQRNDLLRPLIPLLIGTHATPAVEQRREIQPSRVLHRRKLASALRSHRNPQPPQSASGVGALAADLGTAASCQRRQCCRHSACP